MTFQDEDENMDKVVEGRDFHAWRNLMEVVDAIARRSRV